MNTFKLNQTDQEVRLFEMGAFGFLAINYGAVNLDDLLDDRPGQIVRCIGNPADVMRFFPADHEALGCVAGWISEDEAEHA